MPVPMRGGRGPVPTVFSARIVADGGETGDAVAECAIRVFRLGLGRTRPRADGVELPAGGRGKSRIVSSLMALLRSSIPMVDMDRERTGAMTAADTDRRGTALAAVGRGRTEPLTGAREPGLDSVRVRVRVRGRGPPSLDTPDTGGCESEAEVERTAAAV